MNTFDWIKRAEAAEAALEFIEADFADKLEFQSKRAEAAEAALGKMVEAAQAVCWFDWSGNDSDAAAAIDRLRATLASQDTKNE